MLTRVYTDVTASAVQDLIEDIEADNGTFQRFPQPDGTETIVADFADLNPPPQAAPPAAGQYPWMPIANGEIGQKEGHNLRITEYFKTTTLGPQPDSVPWCSAFVNFCVTRSGVAGTNSALARSWLNWGTSSADFVEGCIVVLARGGPTTGHVAFYVGQDGDRIQLLGGNQGDEVKVASYSQSAVIDKRIPTDAMLAQAVPAPAVAAPPAGAGAIRLDAVAQANRPMAQHVIDAFAGAGFGVVQQATALANAIAESGLDPHAHATVGEDSVGLFQLNRNGGLGTGHSVAELMDPDNNIAIIMGQARNVPDFVSATTLAAAMTAFVVHIERPRDQPGEIAKRLQIAGELLPDVA
ncbi:MAG TPA: TIGR02594 family protein [Stellaceae bacterium]|jgi:uncharacterized protein (TIGR02594 family)|nr:TIGR02594 family protein [Stellaceae bacterium]